MTEQGNARAVCECGHGVGVHGPSCPCGCESFRAVGPLEAERDRYREALTLILGADPQGAHAIAREVLDG